SVPDGQSRDNPTNEPTEVAVRSIFERNGLLIHRSADNASHYDITHVHSGKLIVGDLPRLFVAFEFMSALDQVYDIDGLKDDNPQPSQHQRWCIKRILAQALRCSHEGWYVPPSHFIRD